MRTYVSPKTRLAYSSFLCSYLLLAQAFGQTTQPPRIGEPAPMFEAEGLAGLPIRLEDFQGRVVLLDFWATWCVPCIQELPNVVDVHDRYSEYGFEIIGISLDKSRDDLIAFLFHHEEINWRQIYGEDGGEIDVASLYSVQAIPHTVLLDPSGVILDLNLRGDELGLAVRAALNRANLLPLRLNKPAIDVPIVETPDWRLEIRAGNDTDEIYLSKKEVLGKARAALSWLETSHRNAIINGGRLNWRIGLPVTDKLNWSDLGVLTDDYLLNINGVPINSYEGAIEGTKRGIDSIVRNIAPVYTITLRRGSTEIELIARPTKVTLEGAVSLRLHPSGSRRSYFQLDEESGTQAIDQWGERHATILGSASWNSRPDSLRGSSSLIFKTLGDGLQLPNDTINNMVEGTLMCWIFPTKRLNRDSYIISKRRDGVNPSFDLLINSDGKIEINFGAADNFGESETEIPLNSWTHVAITWNGVRKQLYIDGFLDSSGGSPYLRDDPRRTYVGRSVEDPAERFIGKVDEIIIWDRPLSRHEIRVESN